MWVDTADLPTNDGHPYFERLNRVLADSGFDAFVEELCAAFYADRLGRPSLRPGRYARWCDRESSRGPTYVNQSTLSRNIPPNIPGVHRFRVSSPRP